MINKNIKVGQPCNVRLVKTDELVATGTVGDYFKSQEKDIVDVEFSLEKRLPFKNKETTYTKYLFDKGKHHIIFHPNSAIYKTKCNILYLEFFNNI